jgi:hypothetical protein
MPAGMATGIRMHEASIMFPTVTGLLKRSDCAVMLDDWHVSAWCKCAVMMMGSLHI